MATYCGSGGKIVIGTHTIAEMKDWSLDVDNPITTTPKFLDTAVTKKVCGPYDWKGSCSGYWDMTDTLGQKVIHDINLAGTTVSAKFYVDTIKYYSGTIYIPTQNIVSDATPGTVVTFGFTFEGSGDLGLTLA